MTNNLLEDATSERLPSRKMNKNLIKVESHTRKQALAKNNYDQKSPFKDIISSIPMTSGQDAGSLINSKAFSQFGDDDQVTDDRI